MEKTNALYLINSFGVNEEIELIKEGKNHEAFQIRYARQRLLYVLIESVEAIPSYLNAMTSYTIDRDGCWEHEPFAFVHDEFTRNLLKELKRNFAEYVEKH